ncbi:hypothetical protein DPMN_172603 [Dreissena polymorpha]|uniref:Uncharacterized protein n=1 Tax=Dreissena polymorpha TaxID=45954 RepID=A0A9D4IFA9_DREPO|nr:hypothetical protein DPMN_172603 [Dreissena polymorpha]
MIEKVKTTDNSPKLLRDALHTTEKQFNFIQHNSLTHDIAVCKQYDFGRICSTLVLPLLIRMSKYS